MAEEARDEGWPASLNWLKRLVAVLAMVMIAGFVLLIAMLVRSLNAPAVALPEGLALPEGVRAGAVTAGQGWYAVVTMPDDGGAQRLLVFGPDGALRHDYPVE